MKFKLYKELLDSRNIMSHVFLECCPEDLAEKITDKLEEIHKQISSTGEFQEIDNDEIDITLLIEGVEVDCKKFFNLYNDQHNDLIRQEATNIVQEQLSEKLKELRDKIDEYAEIIESWSEDINWEITIPLTKNKE